MFYNATEILLFHDAIGKGNVLKYDDTENYFGGGKKKQQQNDKQKSFLSRASQGSSVSQQAYYLSVQLLILMLWSPF